VVAEHVAKRDTNRLTVERNLSNKEKRSSSWKSSNNPEAPHSTTNSNPPKYHCNYCDKDGHTEDRCYKKKRDMKGGDKGEIEQMLCVYETALIVNAIEDGYVSDQIFIADTGASSHMVYSKRYRTNIQEMDTKVTAGNNITMQCTLK
jgi:hypothetical protein